MSLKVDQEFVTAMGPILQSLSSAPKPKLHDIEGRRAFYDAIPPPAPRIPDNVSFEIVHIESQDGYKIPIYHLKRHDSGLPGAPSAAVIHAHGGGLIAMSPAISVQRLADMVAETGVQAFSVDYRLAPEHAYPAALDDCWACLSWLRSSSSFMSSSSSSGGGPPLHVDPARIAVMGESAGGGLAAALAIRARDAGLQPPIAHQILSSPMLDDRTQGEVPGDFKLWDAEDNLTAWTAYLGGPPGGDSVSALAAPGRLADAAGLPPLYLDTSQFDLFVKENVAYVQKFLEAGVEVESHLYPGLPHGFDGLLPTHSVSVQLEDNRKRILKSL